MFEPGEIAPSDQPCHRSSFPPRHECTEGPDRSWKRPHPPVFERARRRRRDRGERDPNSDPGRGRGANSSWQSSPVRRERRRDPVHLARRRQSGKDCFVASRIPNAAVDLPRPRHLTRRQAIRRSPALQASTPGSKVHAIGSVTVRSRTPSAASHAVIAASSSSSACPASRALRGPSSPAR